jgi:hypothetical protein
MCGPNRDHPGNQSTETSREVCIGNCRFMVALRSPLPTDLSRYRPGLRRERSALAGQSGKSGLKKRQQIAELRGIFARLRMDDSPKAPSHLTRWYAVMPSAALVG